MFHMNKKDSIHRCKWICRYEGCTTPADSNDGFCIQHARFPDVSGPVHQCNYCGNWTDRNADACEVCGMLKKEVYMSYGAAGR